MRRMCVWLSAFALAAVCGTASATPSGFASADGDWSDWFTYGGTGSADWDQSAASGSVVSSLIRSQNAPLASHNGGAGITEGDGTNPAYGGQLYDVEQIFYYFEDFVPGSDSPANTTGGILHIGLVTGFPPGGTVDFLAGDLFIGFGAGTAFDSVAIGVSTNSSDSSRYEQIYDASNPATYVPVAYTGHSISNYYRVSTTGDDGHSGVVEVAWGGDGQSETALAGGSATHYFMEVALGIDGATESLIADPDNGGLSLHWTMGCGNDYINVNDNTPFDPPPVPEPSTLILLGMGALGLVMRARHPIC